jgi:demethylmenaquinone methyltransferase/2-methoxy-6-polyprenyl-1,4-benzoquinol methylase
MGGGPSTGTLEEGQVRAMFDRISGPYDAINSVMTAGLHHRWRRRAADLARVGPGSRVLDVATGTGDLAVALKRRVGDSGEVVGSDFSERMLELARPKSSEVRWVCGDAMALPFEDASFDVATVGFGIRNVSDLEAGLAELARVLSPGGRLGCLEITQPRGLLRPFFRLWFDGLIPLVGKLLPGGAAYTYLPASVRRFPGPEELAAAMERSGFSDVTFRLLAGGIVTLHTGRRA